ncbi:MAG: molybdenum cofactor guanylyltransferase [Bordetella sp.]|nr:MAG: molybdenum cofactor guanylyltransferase [Bordetella sp.]
MKIAGLILAGGSSIRMGGIDKGLLLLDGKPLVEHVFNQINLHISKLFISANRNSEKYSIYGSVLHDNKNLGSFLGPLGGIAAAMSVWTGQLLVIMPCDSPFFYSCLIKRLILTAEKENASLVVASCNKKRQPVFMVANIKLLSNLETYLIRKNRKVRLWQDMVGVREVDCSDFPTAFLNINTFNDFNQSKAIIRSNVVNHSNLPNRDH